MNKMYSSSFCGVIDEIPYIRADNFVHTIQHKPRAYFLSHCHTDHTQGLYSQELLQTLENTKACIYMSKQTCAVINHENKFNDRLSKYIVPLEPGPNLITIPGNPEKELEEILMDVTLIPAGHSYGSVMFLFRSNLKTILFTGDFRMNINDLKSYKYLHDQKGDPIKIDAMYVDTTFLEDRFLNFPKRSLSVEYMIEEIKQWVNQNPNNAVALHTSAKFGYEFVFNEINKHLGLKVSMDEDRWNFYRTQSVYGVTKEESRIHICKNRTDKWDHTGCPGSKKNYLYLFIHLSAMIWDNYEVDDHAIQRVDNRLNVCFPTHCSRKELKYFVEYFDPKKVIGFPKPYITTPVKKQPILPTKKKIDQPLQLDGKVPDKVIKDIMFDI